MESYRQRWPVKGLAIALAALIGVVMFAVATSATAVRAHPSYGDICVDPDVEFPVPCDDDDED